MARNHHGRIVRGEAAAFEKMTAALTHAQEAAMGLSRRLASADLQRLTHSLRQAIEAATEISTWRSDPRWFAITQMLERMLQSAGRVQIRTTSAGGSSTPPAVWKKLAGNFEKMRGASLSLWQEAEKNAVQGGRLQ